MDTLVNKIVLFGVMIKHKPLLRRYYSVCGVVIKSLVYADKPKTIDTLKEA